MSKKILNAYGVEQPLVQVPHLPLNSTRAPTTTDTEFALGDVWIFKPTVDTGASYVFCGINSTGGAIWALQSPGASDVDTINSLSPVLGNIIIDGGTNITDVNAGNTVTLNLDAAITLATSVTSPIFASAAAMAINPVGALTVTGGTTIDVNAAAGSNITLQMGDAAGANVIDFEDSASATVASLNSNGQFSAVNLDGIIGAVTPAAITGTTITASTSVTSPSYTASAADAVLVAGGVNDVVLRLGDNAGATFLRVQDSDSADLWTIDSNGTVASFTGLTVAGAAISLNDNSNFNTSLNTGTSTGTVSIGNLANSGTIIVGSSAAITVDTAAGISLDAATGSNFTVTGAADLALASTTGGVNITSGEAATATGITIDATAVDGGVSIDGGSNGINIATSVGCTLVGIGDIAPTASRVITIGGGVVATAAVTDTIDIGPDGATTNANSIKTVNVNTGGVTTGQVLTNIGSGAVTSGTHTVNIQSGNAAAGTVATNLSTGTGTKTVNVGNADALTTVNIDAITAINDSINANFSACTGTSTGQVTLGNIATSTAMALQSSTTVDIDAAGAVSLNSTGAAINIGNDANAFAVNIGTGAAARTVTIGSTNTTSATVIQSGTGEITMTGTVKQIDAELMGTTGVYIPTINMSPIMTTAATTGGVATGATGDVNLMSLQNQAILEQFILGAGQTIIAPRMSANGLLISLDLTATEGAEYNFGGALDSTFGFTVGSSGAFFFELDLYINDMDGADPYIFGFRKTEANNATLATYTDYYALGMNASTSATEIVIFDELNATGQTITNTTDVWGGDGTTNTLRVDVSAAGVCTSYINGVIATAAPAFTFDADRVTPFIRLTHSASPTQVAITGMRIGLQA